MNHSPKTQKEAELPKVSPPTMASAQWNNPQRGVRGSRVGNVPSSSQPGLQGTLSLGHRNALPSTQGSLSFLHPSDGCGHPHSPAPSCMAQTVLQKQLRLCAADTCPARQTEVAFQPQCGSFGPVRTYVCAKDSVRHLGVSERQGEKQGYWWSCLLPVSAVLTAGAEAPLPGQGLGTVSSASL